MPGLMCVHPHPDDESIACGGVIHRAITEGRHVTVVTCTRGEAGEILSGIDIGEEALTEVRQRELAEALRRLGVTDHHYLGYRDSGMAGTAENDDPDSFHRADVEEAARRLARIIRVVRPDVVVSDPADGSYGHPDHVKAYVVTSRAVELAADAGALADADAAAPWEVPKRYVTTIPRSELLQAHNAFLAAGIASPFGTEPLADPAAMPFGAPDEEVTTSVDVLPWIDAKRAAMAAHESQIGPDSFFLNVPEGMSDDLFGREHFVRLRPSGHDREDDLFAGLT